MMYVMVEHFQRTGQKTAIVSLHTWAVFFDHFCIVIQYFFRNDELVKMQMVVQIVKVIHVQNLQS